MCVPPSLLLRRRTTTLILAIDKDRPITLNSLSTRKADPHQSHIKKNAPFPGRSPEPLPRFEKSWHNACTELMYHCILIWIYEREDPVAWTSSVLESSRPSLCLLLSCLPSLCSSSTLAGSRSHLSCTSLHADMSPPQEKEFLLLRLP